MNRARYVYGTHGEMSSKVNFRVRKSIRKSIRQCLCVYIHFPIPIELPVPNYKCLENDRVRIYRNRGPSFTLSSSTPSSPCRTGVSDPGGTLAEPKKSPNDQSTFGFENERELRKKNIRLSRDWNPGPPVSQAGALPLDHGGTDTKS